VGGTCTVDGTINADGKAAGSESTGSGGSVYITCGNFGGSGTVRANGGVGTRADVGGGGGGRVAVVLTNGTSFGSVTLQALPGWQGGRKPGGGTVFTKTATQSYGILKIENANNAALVDEAGGRGTLIPDGATWEVEGLILVSNAHLRVTNSATLNLRGAQSFAGSETDAYLIIEAGGTLNIGSGSLTVSNVTVMPNSGAMLTGLTNLTVAAGGVLSHLPNVGNSQVYKLKVEIPGSLTINSGGKVDVSARGYDSTYGPGAPTPGYNGGSHGGQGGSYQNNLPLGQTYGSVVAPTNSGSGPGNNGNSSADGGGVARLIVGGATTVEGEILADGGNSPSGFAGGAGGSIWLTTATLAGSGTIRAGGGVAISRPDTGSGGGGRVAVTLKSGNSFGSIDYSARGGTTGGSGASAPGTVYLEAAADVSGGGRVIIDADGEDHQELTVLPPERDWTVDELRRATVVVTNDNSEVWLSTNLTVSDVYIFTNAYMALGDFDLSVRSREHHLGSSDKGPGNTNRVDYYDHVLWIGLRSGTVFSIW
jgi:hypothetical protein